MAKIAPKNAFLKLFTLTNVKVYTTKNAVNNLI